MLLTPLPKLSQYICLAPKVLGTYVTCVPYATSIVQQFPQRQITLQMATIVLQTVGNTHKHVGSDKIQSLYRYLVQKA